MSRELQRLNMNMPASLIKEVDEYADRMNLNRTSAVILLVTTALKQKNAVDAIDELLVKLSELEEKTINHARIAGE